MARIKHHVTVVRDGMHNAFTDLQYWQGCYWVAYRKGSGHTSMEGEGTVSVSADRVRFREVAHIHVPGDNRDPKMLPLDENRMALYMPSWVEGVKKYKLQQFITFTDNGFDWEKPAPILDPQLWLWRIRKHDGKYYGLIQNLKQKMQLDLMVSDDLFKWETVARIGENFNLCESDIFWHEDGEAWVVARSVAERDHSVFCSARPPYTEWETVQMNPMIHAPVFVHHENELYVAGRNLPPVEGDMTFPFDTPSLGVWRVTRGQCEAVLRIPATGDCSYPGLIKDPDGRICMSYYSQHAYMMGVVNNPHGLGDYSVECTADDVYFAELEI